MVECLNKDINDGYISHTHTQGQVNLQHLKQEFDLIDKWRYENDKQRQHTWASRKQNETTKSRLDRFYIQNSIKHIKTEFVYNIWSDHKIVSAMVILGKQEKRGQNYWKLNTEILQDIQYRTEMTTFINNQKTLKLQYENVIEWCEMTKTYIKMYTKKYCQNINQKRQKEISRVKRDIEHESTQTRINMTNIELLHNELQNLQNEKQKGVQIRSKEKMILNEEKPTKYFYIRERQQQQKKTIQKLEVTENNHTIEVTENKEILHAIHQYFTQVYTEIATEDTLQEEFLRHINTPLTEQDKQNLEQPITRDELKTTIQNTDANKSPGIDGLPL